MGDDAPQSRLVALGFQGNIGRRWNSNGAASPSENKVGSKAQFMTRRWKESKRPRMILMKRRHRSHEGSRMPANVFEKRVRVLRKLVPVKEFEGVDGLFRDTMVYILALEMRVKAMQIMVKALSGSDE